MKKFLKRIAKAKVGDAELEMFPYGEAGVDKERSDDTPAKTKSGSEFWLGHDLMWTVDVLLRGGSKKHIRRGFRQSLINIKETELNESFTTELQQLHDDAADIPPEDWDASERDAFARRVTDLLTRIGASLRGGDSSPGPGPG